MAVHFKLAVLKICSPFHTCNTEVKMKPHHYVHDGYTKERKLQSFSSISNSSTRDLVVIVLKDMIYRTLLSSCYSPDNQSPATAIVFIYPAKALFSG